MMLVLWVAILVLPAVGFIVGRNDNDRRWIGAFAGLVAGVCLGFATATFQANDTAHSDTYYVIVDVDYLMRVVIGFAILCVSWWLMSTTAARLPRHLSPILFWTWQVGSVMAILPYLQGIIHVPQAALDQTGWLIMSQSVGGWFVVVSIGATFVATLIALVNIWRTRRNALRMDKTGN
jgi:hypothetical protein